MITGLLYGFVADSNTRVRCVFCGVYIPKSNKSIEEHASGAKHLENIELIEENGISLNEEGNHLYCKICKVVLEENVSVSKHIEEDTHANWIAIMEDIVEDEFLNLDQFLASGKDKEDIFCEACQCSFICTLDSTQDHVNSYNHRAKVVEKLKPLNGIFRVENDDEVWCKICDMYIENTVEGILNHVDSGEHLDWLVDINYFIVDNDISIADYLANEYETNAFCNKCNIQIPCNMEKIEEHVISELHLNNLS